MFGTENICCFEQFHNYFQRMSTTQTTLTDRTDFWSIVQIHIAMVCTNITFLYIIKKNCTHQIISYLHQGESRVTSLKPMEMHCGKTGVSKKKKKRKRTRLSVCQASNGDSIGTRLSVCQASNGCYWNVRWRFCFYLGVNLELTHWIQWNNYGCRLV